MESQEQKVPILKQDAKVMVEVDFNSAGAIAQSLFVIAGKWTDEERKEFQTLLNEKKELSDISQLCYIYLDRLYRLILVEAKKTEQLEYRDLNQAANPLN